jgi:hypothetical protein
VPIILSTLAHQVGGCTVAWTPLFKRVEVHVLSAERLPGDDTTVPVLAKGKTDTGRIWVNGLPSGRYSPLHAAGAYQLRRRRGALIERDRALRTFVVDRLAEGWTPEQISGWLKGGNEPRLRAVGCETIYAFIYRAGLPLHSSPSQERLHSGSHCSTIRSRSVGMRICVYIASTSCRLPNKFSTRSTRMLAYRICTLCQCHRSFWT